MIEMDENGLGNDLLNDVEVQLTASNPEGFFAETDNNCSVKVAVRIRPFVGRELRTGSAAETCIQSTEKKLQIGSKEFGFDKVFDIDSYQTNVFEMCAHNLLLGCFGGYNATILAYGQTGSGKTHTMGTGSTVGLSHDQIGIVPRVFDFIFEELDLRKKQNSASEFSLKVQFLELYGEDIHDLLDMGPIDKVTGQQTKTVQIREEKNGTIKVEGLKSELVTTKQECIALLNKGIALRVTSSTMMNEGSSRSHAIFTITIDQKIVKVIEQSADKPSEDVQISEENISAKFHFVDLAGSERIKKTGASGKQMQEGISINKGLLALGNVIAALTDEKKIAAGKQFIPYRDSKLTRILQDSLGGNSRTTMIACVSPAEQNHEESLSTIKYASRARNIKNKPVINRDANSMLIESLRATIQNMGIEITEYQNLLKSNDISIPDNFNQKLQSKAQEKDLFQKNESPSKLQMPDSGGASNEVRELKIKLARKEKELKDCQDQLTENKQKSQLSNQDNQALQNERDELILKQEQMSELLSKNNILIPQQITQAPTTGGKRTQTLIDEYKAKVQKFQAELEKKNTELLAKSKKIAELNTQMKRDEQILKKAFEESARLKKNASVVVAVAPTQGTRKGKDDVPDAETIKNQFMDKLTSQLENFFGGDSDTSADFSESSSINSEHTPSKRQLQIQEHLENNHAKQSIDEASKSTLEEKEKILAAVRQNVDVIKSDLSQLLQNTWAKRIQEIEVSMNKVKIEKQKQIAASGGSQDKNSAIEKEYMAKMEALNKQLSDQQKEKKKKEDNITKTMVLQEQRLKAMETEITKMKLQKEELESQKKYGEERFSKFKTNVNKDLVQSKKTAEDKTKVVNKLKIDLKKTDQLVQQKMAELRGLQKKVKEEKDRRIKEEDKENSSQGIDIDVIKDWITQNTEQLLKQQELNEFLKKQIRQRNEIEDEMFSEGDRLTELSIQQERLQFEQVQILQSKEEGEGYDEARDLEIEIELEDIATESNSITSTLDTLEEHLEFVSNKINKIREEIGSFDMDSIQPPRFKGLNSVEMARATLRTFFMVLLDLNVYKRDLETKCIEQDEKLIDLQTQVTVLSENSRGVDKNALIRKHHAMQQLVSKIGDSADYIDNREATNLDLTTQEQSQLTKLSLSKIVNNLRSKLKDEEKRNQSLNLKLDSVLKEKEQMKQKFSQSQREKRNTGQMSGTFGSIPQVKAGVVTQVKSKINTGLTQSEKPKAIEKPKQTTQVEHTRRMSFKQRRDLVKEQKDSSDLKNNQHSLQSVENLLKSIKKPEIEKKTNKQLIDQLTQLEDEVNKNKTQMTAEERQSKKRAYLQAKTTEFIKEDIPQNSFLTSPSQPETVPEVDEEDDNDNDEDLLDNEIQIEEHSDERMKLLMNSGEKFRDAERPSKYSASIIEQEVVEERKEYQWVFEQVVGLPIDQEQSILAIDAADQRLFIVYDDMTILEVNLESKEVVQEFNLAEVEDAMPTCGGFKANCFAMFKDLNMLAIATDDNVHLFDYESEFTLVTTLPVTNVIQIAFIELYIILLVESEDLSSASLTCYQMDSKEPEGQITINQFMGQQIMMQKGDQAIFYATGMQFGRISVPEMELQFQEDSGHQIIDFAVSDTCLFTTGKDSSIRVFDCESGMILIEPMPEMECDALSVQGYHVVARCGGGQAMFVFKYMDGNEELEEEDFIECDDLYAEIIEDPTGNNRNFLMRGGLIVKTDGYEYNCIVFANLTEQGVKVSMLKGKAY